jgi:Subtilase family
MSPRISLLPLCLLTSATAVSWTNADFIAADPACGPCEVVGITSVSLPLTNVTYQVAKLFHRDTQQIDSVGLTPAKATVVDLTAQVAEQTKSRQLYGVFSQDTFNYLTGLPGAQVVTAYVWGRVPRPALLRASLISDAGAQWIRSNLITSVSASDSAVAARVTSIGGLVVQNVTPGIPLQVVSGPAAKILQLGPYYHDISDISVAGSSNTFPGFSSNNWITDTVAAPVAVAHGGPIQSIATILESDMPTAQVCGQLWGQDAHPICGGGYCSQFSNAANVPTCAGVGQLVADTGAHSHAVAGVIANQWNVGMGAGTTLIDWGNFGTDPAGGTDQEMNQGEALWYFYGQQQSLGFIPMSTNYSYSYNSCGHQFATNVDDQIHDWTAKNFGFGHLFVASAGNTDDHCGLSYSHRTMPNNCRTGISCDLECYVQNEPLNGLTVGATDGLLPRANDRVCQESVNNTFTSSWQNPKSIHNDRELPELSAPGLGVDTAGVASGACPGNTCISGTSFAAPAVTGAAMLIAEHTAPTSGVNWPETLRSILMATADHNLSFQNPPLAFDTINDFNAGVGEINAQAAVGLAAPGNYANAGDKKNGGFWYFNSTSLPPGAPQGNWTNNFYRDGMTPNGQQKNYYFVLSGTSCPQGQRVRGVLAFDSSVAGLPTDATMNSVDQLDADLDLLVFDAPTLDANTNGNKLGQSTSQDNSYEVVDIACPVPAKDMYFEIYNKQAYGTDTNIGLAVYVYTSDCVGQGC